MLCLWRLLFLYLCIYFFFFSVVNGQIWIASCAFVSSGFLASKVPENLDAVIIGSGIGGLGLAVLLAKVGKKVLVLEQHDRAGGCCHTFCEKGYEFDVGEFAGLFSVTGGSTNLPASLCLP